MPSGLVQGGLIADPDKFSQIVKQALTSKQANSTSQQEVVIGLPEEHAFIKLINIPKSVKAKELAGAFAYQWQSIFPINIDRVYYDSIPVVKETKLAMTQYLIIAYPREIIDSLAATMQRLGSRIHKMIPLSFGTSALVSPSDGTAAMVVESEDGKKLLVTVAQHGMTRFSSLVRTSIGSANATKQIEAIKRFYDQSVENDKGKITKIVIIRSRFAETLAKQLKSFNLPVEITRLDQLLHANDKGVPEFEPNAMPLKITKAGEVLKIKGAGSYVYDLDHYTSLYGLLRDQSKLSIVPPAVAIAHQRHTQETISLIHFVTLLGSTVMALSVLLVMHRVLLLTGAHQADFSPATIQSVDKQEEDVAQSVQTLNQSIATINQLTNQNNNVTNIAKEIVVAAQSNSGISIATVTYAPDKKTLTIAGSRSNRAVLNSFLTSLKANKDLGNPTVTLASLQADGVAPFEIDSTIGSKP